MNLSELLGKERPAVLKVWRKRIAETYPPQTAKFVLSPKDASRNPIGHTITEGTEAVYDALLGNADRGALEESLDGLVRLRAVQDFRPSEAVGFVFQLRAAAEDVLAGHPDVLPELSDRIEEIALAAFDVYSACREKIYELRAKQMRDRSYMLMKRAGLLWEEDAPGESSEIGKRGNGR